MMNNRVSDFLSAFYLRKHKKKRVTVNPNLIIPIHNKLYLQIYKKKNGNVIAKKTVIILLVYFTVK